MAAGKSELIRLFKSMAALMELRGDNPFRCRAYENAARAVEGLDGEPAEWIERGSLEGVKGIGKGLTDHIREFVSSGTFAEYDELRAEIPPGLVEMSDIPGLGAKKIQALWKELGIDTVEKLADAAKSGEVAKLAGFGEKTAAKILAGIEQRKKFSGRHRCDVARAAAEAVLARLKSLDCVRRVEVAGSLRRRRETVKDLDFVVDSSEPEAVMDAFVGAPGVERVVGRGPTKSSVLFGSGIPADLRVVEADQFAAALNYFTGSKEHNTRLRGRAKKMGMRLNEYGLFREDDPERALPCADEAAIYERLGLRYVEPELREDRGEVEAAEAGELPALVELADLRGLLHCHSTYSDGKSTLADMARAAIDAGYAYFGICDHSKTAAYARGLKEDDVLRQHEEIDRLNERFAKEGPREGRAPFRILKGIESDILADGSLDYADDFLARFDFVVASVHSRFNLSRGEMTERVRRAVSHPACTILGHPTGRLLLEREPFEIDLDAIFEAAAANGTAMEINANPHRLDLDWTVLRRAKAAGCRFAIDPDAHHVSGVAHNEYGVGIARKGWLGPDDVVNCLDEAAFLAFARKARGEGERGAREGRREERGK